MSRCAGLPCVVKSFEHSSWQRTEKGGVMRCRVAPCAIVIAFALVAIPGGAAVTVSFVNPDFYTDAGDVERDPRQTLTLIDRYLRDCGARYLPPQESLRIEVLDVALACRPRMLGSVNTVTRVCTGEADWPRIELRYRLVSTTASSALTDETVVDTTYLRRLETRYSSASLPYEKRMLDEWFKARFAPHAPPSATP
jgi:hypothetical protein